MKTAAIVCYAYLVIIHTLFFFIKAPLGSIPELPAHSCQEIKASEGESIISNKHWLNLTGNGTSVLVSCDMNLEGY